MSHFKFGLTAEFPCGYLDNKQERLLVYADDEPLTADTYALLQNNGFRRSEDIAYRPHCSDCNACQSIRVIVECFKPSRSQKRIINRCKSFTIQISEQIKPSYYPLFEKYINNRHKDGVMFPAQPSQLDSFAKCSWLKNYYLELYDDDQLIAVAIGDETENALSAVYSFFDPNYSSFSLGTYLILQQIDLAKTMNKQRLYLGYFISECSKMNYKNQFKPYEILTSLGWTSDQS